MVFALAEEQYKFGAGPLLCRVVEVIAPVLFDEALWWHLRGECADGTPDRHGGWLIRELYVPDAVVQATARKRPAEGGRP